MDLLQLLKYIVPFIPHDSTKRLVKGQLVHFTKLKTETQQLLILNVSFLRKSSFQVAANCWGSQLRKTIHQLQLKKGNLTTACASDQWHLLSKFTFYILNRDNWSTLISRWRSPKRPVSVHLASLNHPM